MKVQPIFYTDRYNPLTREFGQAYIETDPRYLDNNFTGYGQLDVLIGGVLGAIPALGKAFSPPPAFEMQIPPPVAPPPPAPKKMDPLVIVGLGLGGAVLLGGIAMLLRSK